MTLQPSHFQSRIASYEEFARPWTRAVRFSIPASALLLTMPSGIAASARIHAPSPHRVTAAAQPASFSRAAGRITALRVNPASLTLDDARDERRVLVSGRLPNGTWTDLTSEASFRPENGDVSVDRMGYFTPAHAGETHVLVLARGASLRFPITVRSAAAPPVSFTREVMPVFSKLGCNAGTCHGSAKGKNGFKLSLRGYDPDYDFRALIDDISARRFNRVHPEESLMLEKPMEKAPHQGGLVLPAGSRYYHLLYHWIVEGVRSDTATTSRVNRLEVLPPSINLPMPGDRQQILVIAHYPDGTTRDVTRDAVFTSSTPDVATITPDGLVNGVRRGEAAVLVRYEGSYGVDNLLVMGDRTGYHWKDVPVYNYIDSLAYKKMQRVKLLPSDLCPDATFMRRVSLDLAGTPPSPDAVRSFLADTTPSRVKREKLVDKLLASPAFVDHWTNKWADLLSCNAKFLGAKGVVRFHDWIHQQVATNAPWDSFVREIVTASGNSTEHPAANYFRVERDPTAATEAVTQLFLGTRFSCNKCHDHPFERWTQKQYYQFGAFFAKVAVKPGANADEGIIALNPAGESIYPKDNKPSQPIFPFGEAPRPVPPGQNVFRHLAGYIEQGPDAKEMAQDPRQRFADWLTSRQNPLFAKSMANRVWSYFFGKGIIEPVDDIRSGNPPSNPELLDAITADFVNSGFDLKHLMRAICTSRLYQLSLKPNRFNQDDSANFSHALPRRLPAEDLLDTIALATGTSARLPGLPSTTLADQLPDTKAGDTGSFLALFGSPPRETPCECERTSQVSLSQALNLVNGPTIADAINDPQGRVAKLAAAEKDDAKLVDGIFLSALCRFPSPQESMKSVKYIHGSTSRLDGAQDLMWGLLTSPEFIFNH